MCNDEEYKLRRQLDAAIRFGASDEEIEFLTKKILDFKRPIEREIDTPTDGEDILPVYHHVSGFSHPIKVVFSSVKPFKAEVAEWGFVPPWVKTVKEAMDPRKPYNNSLNAQSAGIFEKKTFVAAAKYGRCVVSIDAYYEHHQYNGKTYPFRIFRKDGKPLLIAAISNKNKLLDEETGEIIEKITVATLTTSANPTMARIHNNPATLKTAGHRMLVILDEENVGAYLAPYNKSNEEAFQYKILDLCVPYDETKLGYYSVRNLRSRKDMPYIGNVPEIAEPYEWADFDYTRVEG